MYLLAGGSRFDYDTSLDISSKSPAIPSLAFKNLVAEITDENPAPLCLCVKIFWLSRM
jgi:hypothetical protein